MEFTTLIYEGEIFRVEAYRGQSHGILSLEWLEKQPERYQIKFAALFGRLANHGKIYNERKFKHLEASNQIFEFKSITAGYYRFSFLENGSF